jgi:hypothetical protein
LAYKMAYRMSHRQGERSCRRKLLGNTSQVRAPGRSQTRPAKDDATLGTRLGAIPASPRATRSGPARLMRFPQRRLPDGGQAPFWTGLTGSDYFASASTQKPGVIVDSSRPRPPSVQQRGELVWPTDQGVRDRGALAFPQSRRSVFHPVQARVPGSQQRREDRPTPAGAYDGRRPRERRSETKTSATKRRRAISTSTTTTWTIGTAPSVSVCSTATLTSSGSMPSYGHRCLLSRTESNCSLWTGPS